VHVELPVAACSESLVLAWCAQDELCSRTTCFAPLAIDCEEEKGEREREREREREKE
jgi:hypothetical protein